MDVRSNIIFRRFSMWSIDHQEIVIRTFVYYSFECVVEPVDISFEHRKSVFICYERTTVKIFYVNNLPKVHGSWRFVVQRCINLEILNTLLESIFASKTYQTFLRWYELYFAEHSKTSWMRRVAGNPCEPWKLYKENKLIILQFSLFSLGGEKLTFWGFPQCTDFTRNP